MLRSLSNEQWDCPLLSRVMILCKNEMQCRWKEMYALATRRRYARPNSHARPHYQQKVRTGRERRQKVSNCSDSHGEITHTLIFIICSIQYCANGGIAWRNVQQKVTITKPRCTRLSLSTSSPGFKRVTSHPEKIAYAILQLNLPARIHIWPYLADEKEDV